MTRYKVFHSSQDSYHQLNYVDQGKLNFLANYDEWNTNDTLYKAQLIITAFGHPTTTPENQPHSHLPLKGRFN